MSQLRPSVGPSPQGSPAQIRDGQTVSLGPGLERAGNGPSHCHFLSPVMESKLPAATHSFEMARSSVAETRSGLGMASWHLSSCPIRQLGGHMVQRPCGAGSRCVAYRTLTAIFWGLLYGSRQSQFPRWRCLCARQVLGEQVWSHACCSAGVATQRKASGTGSSRA